MESLCAGLTLLFIGMSQIHKKALTLVELLLAVIVMSMIVLTAANVEVASRKMYFSADRQGQLQVRLSAAMEHMVKHIKLAAGGVANIPIEFYADNRGLKIGVDSFASPGIPDHRIAYRHEGTNLRYCSEMSPWPAETCNVAWEDIAANLLLTDLSQPDTTWGLVINYDEIPANGKINIMTITLRGRFDPLVVSSPNNPQVEFTTDVLMPSVSTN